MKLLLDQGLPRSTVGHLAATGVTAEHVGDLGMSQLADEAILEIGRQRSAVVVTLDADFHQILASTHATTPSVVRVRMEGLKGEQMARILAQVLAIANAELAAGAVVSVTSGRIRVRQLPIG